MSKIFGIPVNGLALVIVALLALMLSAVAALAVRNRVLVRLGIRNVGRRRGRTALIVAGLMLGTAIIGAALATGDTMSHTIRSQAVAALGPTDEVVAAKGVSDALATATGGTDMKFFPVAAADRIARAGARSGLVRGVAPVIIQPLAIQDVTSRQNEPRVQLFASNPAKLAAFAEMRSDGSTVNLAQLGPGEVYLNSKGEEKLAAKPGDTLRILAANATATM